MNITEQTLEVGAGLSVLISYNVSHPAKILLFAEALTEQQ